MKYLSDLMFFSGIGAVSYGAWVFHPAAGAITCGSLLIVASLANARAAASEEYKRRRGTK